MQFEAVPKTEAHAVSLKLLSYGKGGAHDAVFAYDDA